MAKQTKKIGRRGITNISSLEERIPLGFLDVSGSEEAQANQSSFLEALLRPRHERTLEPPSGDLGRIETELGEPVDLTQAGRLLGHLEVERTSVAGEDKDTWTIYVRPLTWEPEVGDDRRMREREPKKDQQSEESLGELSFPEILGGLEPAIEAIARLREALKPTLQDHLDKVVAASQANPDVFPTIEAKREFALRLQTLLDRFGWRLCCEKCSEPGVLLARGTESGKFSIQHPDNTQHFGSRYLPPLRLIDQPENKRRHTD